MKRQRKTKAAAIFSKLFDLRAFTCIASVTRTDYVHPLENYLHNMFVPTCYRRELCQNSNLIFLEYVEIYEDNFW